MYYFCPRIHKKLWNFEFTHRRQNIVLNKYIFMLAKIATEMLVKFLSMYTEDDIDNVC